MARFYCKAISVLYENVARMMISFVMNVKTEIRDYHRRVNPIIRTLSAVCLFVVAIVAKDGFVPFLVFVHLQTK